ncbi:hypothetical protein [Streptomyces mirabilis]|uniref:hypothetical protein n=1 Tax=Streptomyces mirabilis TaxID=68239 RepID=UPI0036CC5F82
MTTPQVGVSTIHPTQPYVTNAMFKALPTGLPTDAVTPGGTPTQQDIELAELIRKASAEMDKFCYGSSGGVLYATTDTQTLRARVDRFGRFNINPRFTPVRSLTAFSWGDDVASMTAVTDLSHVEVEPTRLVIPAYPFTGMSSAGPLQFGPRTVLNYDLRVNFSYVNGWACTALASAASAGAVTITVKDATGIFPNVTRLTLRDPTNGTETVIPSAVNGTQLTVPALTYAHSAGVQADDLPDVVPDACAEITIGLMKRKAQEAVRPAVGTGRNRHRAPAAPGEDNFNRGFGLLDSYVQVRTR